MTGGRLRAVVGRLGGTRQARRILVDSRTPLNTDMVLPVVHAMAQDARVEFVFTASEEPDRIREIHAQAPTGSLLIHPRRATLHKWDAYLTSDFMWATLPLGAQRVQMFHGVAGKYGFDAPAESMRCWDRLLFINKRRMQNFVAAGVIDDDGGTARLVGMPKLDALVDGSLRRNAILASLGLDPSRPTVLYAPTWSPESSLNVMGVPLLAKLRELPINVIVKLHDRSLDLRPQYSGGVDWPATLAPLLASGRVVLYDRTNVIPCLAAADVLVTDHSSAGFEYLLLDRPVIRIDLPRLIAAANIHADYVQLLADVSINAGTADAAVAAVHAALENPTAGSAARRHIASDLFYRPGTATGRAAGALYELLQLEPHPSVVIDLAVTTCPQPA